MRRQTIMTAMLAILAWAALLIAMSPAFAAVVIEDPRYCGVENIKRNPDGTIKRSDSVARRFQYLYACPATGLQVGPCPGWAKDHVVPLAVGGCDAIHNMQWLPLTIKSCSGDQCKDRWERKVYQRTAP